MAGIDMTRMNENLKATARSVEAFGVAAREAAEAMNAAVREMHDLQNAVASAEVLSGMGRADLAKWYMGRG